MEEKLICQTIFTEIRNYNAMKQCFLNIYIYVYMYIFSYFKILGVHSKISAIDFLGHVS